MSTKKKKEAPTLNADEILALSEPEKPEAMSAVVNKPILYRCKKGHLWTFNNDNKPSILELRQNGEVTNRSRPICGICKIENENIMYGMDRVQ